MDASEARKLTEQSINRAQEELNILELNKEQQEERDFEIWFAKFKSEIFPIIKEAAGLIWGGYRVSDSASYSYLRGVEDERGEIKDRRFNAAKEFLEAYGYQVKKRTFDGYGVTRVKDMVIRWDAVEEQSLKNAIAVDTFPLPARSAVVSK